MGKRSIVTPRLPLRYRLIRTSGNASVSNHAPPRRRTGIFRSRERGLPRPFCAALCLETSRSARHRCRIWRTIRLMVRSSSDDSVIEMAQRRPSRNSEPRDARAGRPHRARTVAVARRCDCAGTDTDRGGRLYRSLAWPASSGSSTQAAIMPNRVIRNRKQEIAKTRRTHRPSTVRPILLRQSSCRRRRFRRCVSNH